MRRLPALGPFYEQREKTDDTEQIHLEGLMHGIIRQAGWNCPCEDHQPMLVAAYLSGPCLPNVRMSLAGAIHNLETDV